MAHERAPEEMPITQAEWDKLSDASRRWLLNALAELKKQEREKMQARDGLVARRARTVKSEARESRSEDV